MACQGKIIVWDMDWIPTVVVLKKAFKKFVSKTTFNWYFCLYSSNKMEFFMDGNEIFKENGFHHPIRFLWIKRLTLLFEIEFL